MNKCVLPMVNENSLTVRFAKDDELTWPTNSRHMLLIVEPNGPAIDVVKATKSLKSFLREKLQEHGAILFRHTNLQKPDELACMANALGLSTTNYPYFTDNYRSPLTHGVINASSTLSTLPVPPHTEQAFSMSRPSIIGFMCIKEALDGGQTTLHDCLEAYNYLPVSTKENLLETSFCKSLTSLSQHALRANFNTLDRKEIAKICEKFNVDYSWFGSRLSFKSQGPCLTRHPASGKVALTGFWTIPSIHYFFAHYYFVPGASQSLSLLCRLLPVEIFTAITKKFHPFFKNNYRYYFLRKNKEVYIDVQMQTVISKAMWKNSLVFDWKKGDVLFIDNIRTGHSRLPYIGERKIAACVCNYYNTKDLEYVVHK